MMYSFIKFYFACCWLFSPSYFCTATTFVTWNGLQNVSSSSRSVGLERERIKLIDVQILTLYRNKTTVGRRNRSLPQLKCIDGTGRCRSFVPEVVQCYNKGSEGVTIQWKCEANMPIRYYFGEINMNCEGYDYLGDPYILKGSCGLEFTLNDGERTNLIIFVVMVMFIIFVIVAKERNAKGVKTRNNRKSNFKCYKMYSKDTSCHIIFRTVGRVGKFSSVTRASTDVGSNRRR